MLRRAIDKWLKAGVFEAGQVQRSDAGTPQGGVVSPLLANVYLHEVVDKWFEQIVRPRLRGQAMLVRYADDVVMLFERQEDARRVMAVLAKRFAKYGLRLHPQKTSLIDFRRPRGRKRRRGCAFELLGFTHFWARSRRGFWVVRRKTASERLSRALRRMRSWCRDNRHRPIAQQHALLCLKVRGHYAYYGVTGNKRALSQFVRQVERAWRRWLACRSHRTKVPWTRFARLLKRYPLPSPRIVHSVRRSQRNNSPRSRMR